LFIITRYLIDLRHKVIEIKIDFWGKKIFTTLRLIIC